MIERLLYFLKNNLLNWIFLLLILFLPTQFGRHFWPSFSFVYGQRVDYFAPTLYLTDIISVFFIFIFLFQCKLLVPKKTAIIISLFFLCLSIGVFLSHNPIEGWYQMSKVIEFVLLGICLKEYCLKKAAFNRFLITLGIGVILESMLSIFQFMHQSSIGGMLYYLGERKFTGNTPGIANASINGQLILRPYGTFSHPNVLAAYLLLSVLYILFYWNLTRRNITSVLMFMSLVVGSLALFLTFSRIAILLWFFSVFVYLFAKLNKIIRTKRIIYILLFMYLGLVVLFIKLTPLFGRFITLSLRDESVHDRIELAKIAWHLFMTHPLVGVGLGNFINNITYPFGFTRSHLLLQPVHNVFLLIMSEAGITGLLFVLFLLIKSIAKLYTQKKWRLLYILGVCIFLGQFDHYFLTLQQGQLLLTTLFALI